ncbi:MAG: rhodanese-like domain-containing protein [Gammaproteobacteria bacterium]|nr:rhodanese-like domain-containing protein [Gammaproteobacteria bacterium]
MRIDGPQARELVMSGAQLLDVRSPQEFAADAAPGAMNIPLPLLAKYAALLDRTQAVVVYCRSGNRSTSASQWLGANGFAGVYDIGSLRNYYHF